MERFQKLGPATREQKPAATKQQPAAGTGNPASGTGNPGRFPPLGLATGPFPLSGTGQRAFSLRWDRLPGILPWPLLAAGCCCCLVFAPISLFVPCVAICSYCLSCLALSTHISTQRCIILYGNKNVILLARSPKWGEYDFRIEICVSPWFV